MAAAAAATAAAVEAAEEEPLLPHATVVVGESVMADVSSVRPLPPPPPIDDDEADAEAADEDEDEHEDELDKGERSIDDESIDAGGDACLPPLPPF